MLADGPRQSGRTTALLLAALALSDTRVVHFVVRNHAMIRHTEDLLHKNFPDAGRNADLRVVAWRDYLSNKVRGVVPIFDHTVVEALARGDLQ